MSRDRVRSLPGPLRNIFLFTAIYSLLFHVDIFSFQAYLGHKIGRCVWIALKSWNFRPDAKMKHTSTEIIWKKRNEMINPVCTQVSLAKKVRGWLTKQAFW